MQLEDHVQAIWQAINAVPEADRAYLPRFVLKNAHRPMDDVLAHWKQDRASREEAAAIQRHRDERVMNDAIDAAKRLGVEVVLGGKAMNGMASKAKG